MRPESGKSRSTLAVRRATRTARGRDGTTLPGTARMSESQRPPKEPPPPAAKEQEGSPGTRLSVHEIHENVTAAAEEELERPATALLWSGLGAGLTISFSFIGAAYLASLVTGDVAKEAMVALAYPLGFVFVVLARYQLFTEQTLEPVLPLLEHPSRRRFGRLVRLWGLVLAANLVGAVVIALLLARTSMLKLDMLSELDHVARAATEGGFAAVFYKAIFAGWLVALMAWLVAATGSTVGQMVLIALTTAPISALGFKHSIAGSVEAFYRALRDDAGWGEMAVDFIIPAILGNVVGGVLFVALLNHGQVAADRAGTGRTSGE
jgi:formate/nitrite transporter FocA (FNT family)